MTEADTIKDLSVEIECLKCEIKILREVIDEYRKEISIIW